MKFVDSNIFIYHLSNVPQLSAASSAILLRIEQGEKAVTSTFVIAQVCAWLARRAPLELLARFLSFISGLEMLDVIDTEWDDFRQVAMVRAAEDWDDQVILAQMQRTNLSEIYSADQDFDGFPAIRRLFA